MLKSLFDFYPPPDHGLKIAHCIFPYNNYNKFFSHLHFFSKCKKPKIPGISPGISFSVIYGHFYASAIRSYSKADIRNPLSLLAHERSRFATCVQITAFPVIFLQIAYCAVDFFILLQFCYVYSRNILTDKLIGLYFPRRF